MDRRTDGQTENTICRAAWSQLKIAAIVTDDISKWIFVNKNGRIPTQISLKFIPKSPVDNKPTLVQVIVGAEQATSHYLNQWWPSPPTHICGTRGDELIGLYDNVDTCRNINIVEPTYNTIKTGWNTNWRLPIARPLGRDMECLLWVQMMTYVLNISKAHHGWYRVLLHRVIKGFNGT